MVKKEGLNPRRLGLAVGIVWGAGLFLLGLLSVISGYGNSFIGAMGSVYAGYAGTFIGSIIGGIWAFVDGFIAGWLVAWIYNRV